MFQEIATDRCRLCGKSRQQALPVVVRTEPGEKTEPRADTDVASRCPACEDDWGESGGVSCC